jgi:CHAT domain-containing protein
VTRYLLAMVIAAAGPAMGEPVAPAGVDLAVLLRANSPSELQAAIDGVKGAGLSERWARARLRERQAEVLAAAGLVGAAGEAAAKGTEDCGAEAWEVAARLHLVLARCSDALGPDRREAYPGLRGKTADAEIAAAAEVVKRLGDGFAAQVLGKQVEAERAYRTCRALSEANPDKLLGPVVEGLRKLDGATAGEKELAARALCDALNDYADACRRKGSRLYDAQGKTGPAVALLQAAVRLFREAWDAYGDVPQRSDVSKATLLQNRALAMLNLGEVLLYATPFDDPNLTKAQKEAVLKPVRAAVPPEEVRGLLQDALRLADSGRAGGQGQAPPPMHLHWVLLQNLAQAITYETLVTGPDNPTPSLVRAERLARRSADELEGLGLYLEALDAMGQEAKARELGGQMVEAVLVYLHGIELCERAVAGLAPSEGGEYRQIKDALFGRLTSILRLLRQMNEPFPEELLGEWGASWDEMAAQVADLAKARTFADFVQMGAVWREAKMPLIAQGERLRHDLVRMEEKASGRALDEAGQKDLARLRQQWLETVGALAAGADRGYSEAMAMTRVRPAQIQSVLRGDEVVLAYYLWHDVGMVEVLRKAGAPTVVDLSLGASSEAAAKLVGLAGGRDLEGVVTGLVEATREGLWPERTGVTSPEGGTQPVIGKWPRALNLLYRILVEPVAAQIADARTIILVPHGALHYLPFEALIAEFAEGLEPAATAVSVPLDTRFWGLAGRAPAVAYLPTAGSLYYLRTRATRPTSGVGVVTRPRYPRHPEDDAYQQAVAGLAGIGEGLASETREPGPYEAAAATPEAARRVLEAPVGLAVFGCHGKANWRYPLASCLLLAPARGHETDETMRDGETLDLAQTLTMTVAAPVVFLAACQTGQATEVAGGRESGGMGRLGDDLLSLSRGYLIAGARALVTSLWECDPAVTVEFWRDFSRAWMKGKCDVGEAVMAAKREVLHQQAAVDPRAPYATPTWWAGFEVHGDPECRYSPR